jgi:hypothetical protein
MRVNGLAGSLCFGAAAAIALVFVQHLAAPFLPSSRVLVFYLAGVTIAYAALLGSTPRRAIRNGAAAFFGATIVVMASTGMTALAVGLATLLALVRSGLEYSTKPARAIVIEMTLGGLGLAFASWLATPGWSGDALGLWGFALVQSLYFLVPGRGREKSGIGIGDPFERARERLLGLLEHV